jgi:hypothetical protein
VKVCTSVLMNTQAGYTPNHPGENHVSLIAHVKVNHNLRLTQHTSVDYLFHLPIQDQTIVVIGINKTEYIDPEKILNSLIQMTREVKPGTSLRTTLPSFNLPTSNPFSSIYKNTPDQISSFP